ncbi:SIR2 family protein [Paenibacillus sonchi]|uniref:SIR2 family protein n=1 Tax=Paenibacillus sonchi TaxID=373687 RepID=UPI001E38E6AD|nr:SIR2 family protein [Paenibacillus sonchi]MCE3201656.1 SIR2 family protein [Paenibacillus sonchi]
MSINLNLINAIKNNKLILFIGSGLTKPLGLPNWKELIIEFLTVLSSQEGSDYEKYKWLLQGIELGLPNISLSEIDLLEFIKEEKKTIYEVLASKIDVEFDEKKLVIHNMLGSISSKIITTNYDKALETALHFRKITQDNDFYLANVPDSYIMKIHGSIEIPSKCVLFKQDYESLYQESSAAIQRLRALISDNTILFIGFSLNDPYIRYQFDFINSVYNNLGTKHFLLTTENIDVSRYGVEPIQLENWDESFQELLTSLVEIKTSTLLVGSTKEKLLSESHLSKSEISKVAILISSPIDKETGLDFHQILRNFIKFELIIDCYYISESSLQDLDNYDYVFIYSVIHNRKLLIEDRNLKSKFISLIELEYNLALRNVKGIFIFSEKIDLDIDTNEEVTLPIALIADSDMSAVLFKLFKKESINQLVSSKVYNKEQFHLSSIPKGKPKINIYFENSNSKLSDAIEEKKLINFVGREIDLEDIVRKILDTNNRIITIKGSGGIGKTATIKIASIELFKRGFFSDGVHFIDCEFLTDYQNFEYKIAECFGMESTIELKKHLFENQNYQDKLIILDNFEPLLYLEDKDIIKDLVTFICEYSKIVVTSREWLGFDFENKHQLRALTNEEALILFSKYYSGYINKEEIRTLKEDILDKLLNNNPLAIKLVAKNLPKFKDMSLLKNDLEEDFFNIIEQNYKDIFMDQKDQNIERSKSLFQSIYYSYNKLNYSERLLFELLSLFPDGIHMQNIKTFFNNSGNNGGGKFGNVRIADKEITSLENKSLIEISGGFLKLQSIIGRFADHQFSKRSEEEKMRYYQTAIEFTYFFEDILWSIHRKNELDALRIFDKNFNNFMKSLTYIEKFDGSKEEKLQYLISLSQLCSMIEQQNMLYTKFDELKDHFSDLKNGVLALETTLLELQYYEGEFERSYYNISKLLPLNEINKIDNTTDIGRYILKAACTIYSFKNGKDILMYYLQNKYYFGRMRFSYILYILGEYNSYQLFDQKIDYFNMDILYNLGDCEGDLYNKLKEYISGLYKKQYIEIMQSNYILSKMGRNDKKSISKLVVTNPYTKGLRNLMLAFIEEDFEKATLLFEMAIKDLKHIQYHYVEAIYYYSKYLKEKGDVDKSKHWFSLGIKVAEENQYKFLMHNFRNLEKNESQYYNDLDNPNEFKREIDEFIKGWK